MMRSVLITILSWLTLLCVIGCGLFQHKEPVTAVENTADVFIKAGNDYYNRASEKCLSDEERADLYRKSVENYRKALQVASIKEETKTKVVLYIRHLEELLAKYNYDTGSLLVRFDMDSAAKKSNAPKAIPYFKEIVKSYPDTDYADLSYIQLGICYEYLEKWGEAEKAYEALVRKYTDEKGNPINSSSDIVTQGVKFAENRLGNMRRKFIDMNHLLPLI